jgi:hypothetical protein
LLILEVWAKSRLFGDLAMNDALPPDSPDTLPFAGSTPDPVMQKSIGTFRMENEPGFDCFPQVTVHLVFGILINHGE